METATLLARLRRLGMEPSDVEVKSARGGLPSSVVETISAFANGTGGTLLLGIDESADFAPADGFDAPAVRDAHADACANKVDPPCRASIEIEEVEGALVVRLDVPELDPVEKPCFVTTRGAYAGSFIRGGDGDRRLSHYEVTQLLSNRSQPTHDRDVVEGATPDDLDEALVEAYLARVRRRSPAFRATERERLLVRLGVLTTDADGTTRPTVAGLLCLGSTRRSSFRSCSCPSSCCPACAWGRPHPMGVGSSTTRRSPGRSRRWSRTPWPSRSATCEPVRSSRASGGRTATTTRSRCSGS
nr:RNA-binding domain-containing protein [Pseudonocardia sp. AL041005-10]